MPLAAAERADRADAVAVPIASERNVARSAELEDVVDEIGPLLALGGQAHEAFAVGGLFRIERHVFRLEPDDPLVVLVGEAGLVFEVHGVAGPARAKDADIFLAVAVPIAGDRAVLLAAELGPQVFAVPLAIA